MRRASGCLCLIILICGAAAHADAVVMGRDGRAMVNVVTAPHNTSPVVAEAATDLAAMLGRITGATFNCTTGDGAHGIVVGTVADYPAFADNLDGNTWLSRDHYLLRSHGEGIYVIGVTPQAARFAVWDLLHRLGYRLYFASPVWEVVPHHPALSIDIDVVEKPDHVDRRIWASAGGSLGKDRTAWRHRWNIRNRMNQHGSADNIHASHIFAAVLRNRADVFKAHPEYLPLIKGERVGYANSVKFCLSNPDARRIITDYAVNWLDNHPEHASVSIEASDLYNWCECAPCAGMGPIINRMVTLANETAEAVTQRWPHKYVGMLCYAQHDEPPTIDVHPSVAVFITTNLREKRLPTLDLLDAWHAGTPLIGVYDYYSVYVWTLSMPTKAAGGSVAYIREHLPAYHARGSRMLCAEACDDWGPNGLGYYLTSRLLWDIDTDADAVVTDFLTQCFGSAAEPMRRFYDVIDKRHERSGTPAFYDERVTLMVEALRHARAQVTDEAAMRRIDELVYYTRYVELTTDRIRAKKAGDDADHAAAAAALVQFTHRIGDRGLVPWHILRTRPEAKGIELSATPQPLTRADADRIMTDAAARWLAQP